jgi:hypothetical protein
MIFIKMDEKIINNFIHVKNIKHLKFKLKIFSEKIVSKYADFWNLFPTTLAHFFPKESYWTCFFSVIALWNFAWKQQQ